MAAIFRLIGWVILGACAASASIPTFTTFLETYRRSYNSGSVEYELRRGIYEQHLAEARIHNTNDQRLWTAGANEFWDWTPLEASSLVGWHGSARPSHSFAGSRLQTIQKTNFLQKANHTLPATKSWNDLPAMSYIHSQGACGSCWAIAAATILRANAELHNRARTFSVQEMLSCVPNPQECGGQGGCRGATVELAVDWVLKHGVQEEEVVPYEGADTACQAATTQYNTGNVGPTFGMQGWSTLPSNKYEPLMRAIAEVGPTAVSVAAEGWLSYTWGIFDGCSVDAVVNHAVVAIGYGQEVSGTKFWHLQNSWGFAWGEQGKLRLLRRDTDEHECGIDRQPELGVGCKGGPSQVTVCGMCGVLFDSVVVSFA